MNFPAELPGTAVAIFFVLEYNPLVEKIIQEEIHP